MGCVSIVVNVSYKISVILISRRKLQASSRITLKWKSPAPSHEAWRREWSVIVWEDIYALGLDGRHSDPSTLEFQKGHDDATVSLFVRIEEVRLCDRKYKH